MIRKRLRLAYVAAWVILLVASALFTVERSGLLAETIRDRIAWRLGPLGEGLEIRDVRVSLLDPSLELHGVRLTSPTSGHVLIQLDRIEIDAKFPPSRIDPIASVRIDGGQIRIGDEILGELQRILESLQPEDAPTTEFHPPPGSLRRLDVLLELPGEGVAESVLDLGRLSLATESRGEDGLHIVGELLPWLNGAARRSEAIAFEGSQVGKGFAVQARTRGLAVSSDRFDAPPVLAALPLDAFAGALDLDGRFDVRLTDAGTGVRASVRARLGDGSLSVVGHSSLDQATVEIAGGMEVLPGEPLWAREAWMAHSRVDARWLGGPIQSFGSFGRAAPPDSLMSIWAHAPDFPLADPEVERLIGNAPGIGDLRNVLAPRGLVAVTIATTFPMPSPDSRTLESPAAFVRFGFDGRAGITYHGFKGPSGAREGFPLPTTLTRGEVVVHDDPRSERRTRVVLREIEARSTDSLVEIAGVIASPPKQGDESESTRLPELDLAIDLVEVRVGEELRGALAGHSGTREVWETYDPTGGIVRGRITVAGGEDLAGVATRVELDVAGVTATWKSLPVPVEGLRGSIDVRTSAGLLDSWRPVGARVDLATDAAEGDAFRLSLRMRKDSPPNVLPDPRISIEVDLGRLLLRGKRWDTLRAQFEDVGAIVDDLGASGGVSVRYRGIKADEAAPFVHVTEVVPGDPLMLNPAWFPRATRGLRGRVLVRNEDHGDDRQLGRARWLLAATWPDDVDLLAEGDAPFGAAGRSTVVAAGIDPSNETFRGALRVATTDASGQSSIDLTENAVEGRLDVRVETELLADEAAEPISEVRLSLRGNSLRNESIELGGLTGTLVQSGDVFRAARLDAELRGHPIVLDDVSLFPLGIARTLPERDPLLDRENYWLDPAGLCLQAKLTTSDLPLDETHLEDLLSKEALEWIRQDPDWSGLLDLDRAQLVLTNESDGSGKVAIYGRAAVHDMTLRPGLAIAVDELSAMVHELVVEAGRIRMWCEVDDLVASIEGRPLEDATMIVTYLDGRLNVGNLDGAFCGGRLRSAGAETGGSSTAIAADLDEPYGFDLRLVLDDVEADSFLRGVFQSSVADQGQVDAALFLRGKPADLLGIRGNGWVSVNEAQLYSLPVFRALFSALGFDNTAVFDSMRTRFQWRDGRIRMNDIVVKSSLLKLVGDGWMDLDGALHQDLEVRYAIVDRLGPLSLLVNWINNALVRVRIRGDMDRPEVRIETLVSGLFGGSSGSGRHLPLPPFAELEARF